MAVQTDNDEDPVLLCNDLGARGDLLTPSTATVDISGRSSMSVKEAVRVAQSNNFMGLICSSRLLVSTSYPTQRLLLVLLLQELINPRLWYQHSSNLSRLQD